MGFLFHSALTLEDVLIGLNENGRGVLFLVDRDNKLVGVVSDFDVRRAILKNRLTLKEVINTSPEFLISPVDLSYTKNLLRSKRIRAMPILDSDHRLLEIVYVDDSSFDFQDSTVVIMAGGVGSRLGALTSSTPKPMLDLDGKPIVHRIIDSFFDCGFRKFVLCLNYKSQVFIDYFGSGEKYDISMEYVLEDTSLGTAGALSLIDAKDINCPFVVINGDVLTSINYIDLLNFHLVNRSKLTMCTRKVSEQIDFGVVDVNEAGNVVSIREKPEISYDVSAGIYVLCPELLDLIPRNTAFDMPSLVQMLIKKNNKVSAFRTEEYWIDVGRPDDLTRANLDMRRLGEKMDNNR